MGIASAMVAGCAGLAGDTEPAENSVDEGPGRFRLLISDQPAAIGDFSELNVTFEKARIFRAEQDDGRDDQDDGSVAPENESEIEQTDDEVAAHDLEADDEGDDDADDESEGADAEELEEDDQGEADNQPEAEENEDDADRGFVEIDLDGERADLTGLVGDRSTQIAELPLESGRYSSIHLYVDDVEGIASEQYDPDVHPGRGNGRGRGDGGGPPREPGEGDAAEDPVELEVKIPGEKLKIVRPFEIAPDRAVAFVFDVNVIRRGNGSHLLKPVIGESGIVGEDVAVEDVDAG